MATNKLNPRPSAATADAYVREAEPRWVTDGGTIERLRRSTAMTAEPMSAAQGVIR